MYWCLVMFWCMCQQCLYLTFELCTIVPFSVTCVYDVLLLAAKPVVHMLLSRSFYSSYIIPFVHKPVFLFLVVVSLVRVMQ